MIDFPEVIETPMTEADVTKARTEIGVTIVKPMSQNCPVAQVLRRVRPDVRWIVGTDSAHAFSHDNAEQYPLTKDALAGYALDTEARMFVARWAPDSHTEPVPVLRMTRQEAPETTAHSGQE
jgi:hypothetical protein